MAISYYGIGTYYFIYYLSVIDTLQSSVFTFDRLRFRSLFFTAGVNFLKCLDGVFTFLSNCRIYPKIKIKRSKSKSIKTWYTTLEKFYYSVIYESVCDLYVQCTLGVLYFFLFFDFVLLGLTKKMLKNHPNTLHTLILL